MSRVSINEFTADAFQCICNKQASCWALWLKSACNYDTNKHHLWPFLFHINKFKMEPQTENNNWLDSINLTVNNNKTTPETPVAFTNKITALLPAHVPYSRGHPRWERAVSEHHYPTRLRSSLLIRRVKSLEKVQEWLWLPSSGKAKSGVQSGTKVVMATVNLEPLWHYLCNIASQRVPPTSQPAKYHRPPFTLPPPPKLFPSFWRHLCSTLKRGGGTWGLVERIAERQRERGVFCRSRQQKSTVPLCDAKICASSRDPNRLFCLSSLQWTGSLSGE